MIDIMILLWCDVSRYGSVLVRYAVGWCTVELPHFFAAAIGTAVAKVSTTSPELARVIASAKPITAADASG